MTNSENEHVVVIGPDGQPMAIPVAEAASKSEDPEPAGDANGNGAESVADMVEQPAKVMRIGTMIKQLL